MPENVSQLDSLASTREILKARQGGSQSAIWEPVECRNEQQRDGTSHHPTCKKAIFKGEPSLSYQHVSQSPTPPHPPVLCLAKPLPAQLKSLQLAAIKPVLVAAVPTIQIISATSIGRLAT
ncbi:uncharacterized protein UDID_18840 [Ustilago sp. UG-2017a]|nr:uncharacterized protein UDID_18840 [Ustilago sp. UG-2017a]